MVIDFHNKSQRQLRYSENIRRILGSIMLNDSFTGIKPGFFTVHSVDISPDLRKAKIFVYPLDLILTNDPRLDEKSAKITELDIINSNSYRIQSEIVKQIRSKYTPTIQFLLDISYCKTLRIEQLLQGKAFLNVNVKK